MKNLIIAKIAYFEGDYQNSYHHVCLVPLELWDKNIFQLAQRSAYQSQKGQELYESLQQQLQSNTTPIKSDALLMIQALCGEPYMSHTFDSTMTRYDWLECFYAMEPHMQKEMLIALCENGYLKNAGLRSFVLHLACVQKDDDLVKDLVESSFDGAELSYEWLGLCSQALNADFFNTALRKYLSHKNCDQKLLYELYRMSVLTESHLSKRHEYARDLCQRKPISASGESWAILYAQLASASEIDEMLGSSFLSQKEKALIICQKSVINKKKHEAIGALNLLQKEGEMRSWHYFQAVFAYQEKDYTTALSHIDFLESQVTLNKEEYFLKTCIAAHRESQQAILLFIQGQSLYYLNKQDQRLVQSIVMKNQGKIHESHELSQKIKETQRVYWQQKKIYF